MAKTMRSSTTEKKLLTPAQRRYYRQQLKKKINRIQKQIATLTQCSPPLPAQIIFTQQSTLQTAQFCGRWENKKLYVAQQLLHRPLLLAAVLYREMYSTLLPSVVQKVPESSDLGLLCAYRFFTKKKKEALIKIWQVVSPRRYFGDITYDAPVSLPLFDTVTQGTLLREILSYFDELEPTCSPLSSREYIELLETFMLNYTSPLNKQEFRILHLLQERPNATLQQLHELSSLSLGTLSNYLAGLREKLLLSRFYRINFPKIRLNHIAVLAYSAPGSRVNKYLECCPYLRKIHRFGGVGAPYLLTYTLPRLRIRRLREWFHELVVMGHLTRYRFYPLTGVFHGYNVRSYLAQRTDVPIAERFRWVAWIRFLRDVLIRDGYGEVINQPYLYQYSEPHIQPATLEPIDYQILANTSPEITAETLAQLIGKSIHKIRRRQRTLFTQQVLFKRPDLRMFHLGLNESIFIIFEGDKEIVHNFLAGCQEAPMYGGSVFTYPNPGCIVAFGLPTGLALKVGRELGSLFIDQGDFNAAIFFGNGPKDFAVTSVLKRCQYDTSRNQWTWHREYLPTAFDHVEPNHDKAFLIDGLHI